MNAKHTVLALSLLALVGAAQAGDRHHDRGHGKRQGFEQRQPRESYTEESVRKTADGKTFKRKTEQKVTDNGFNRRTTLTNPDGKTATREVSGSYDKDKKTFTRSEKGTDFDGKSWSREATGERTPDGARRDSEWTNRRGGHGHREATISRDGDTVTRDVKTTRADGSTTEKTTTRQKP